MAPGRATLLLIQAGLLLAVALAAWVFTGAMTSLGQIEERRRLAAAASTAAAALDPLKVAAALDPSGAERAAALSQVRATLTRLRPVYPDVRLIYLMQPSAGGFVILAGSEGESPPGQSAQGQPTRDRSAGPASVMRQGQPLVEEPHGAGSLWIRALAPVNEARSGRPLAVLGLEVSHDQWAESVGRYRLFALAASALFAGMIALFLAGDWRQRRFNRELGALNGQLAAQLAERRRAQEELRLAGEVLAHTGDGVFVADGQGLIQSINPAFERITGYGADEAVGKPARWLYLMENTEAPLAALRDELLRTGHWHGQVESRRKNGERYPMEITVSTIRDESGTPTHFAAIFRDDSAQRALQARLHEMASIDGLTGLANRRRFDEVLAREWQRAVREREPLSLLMADLDFFKRYNDLHGHLGGDECLRRVADAVAREARRPGDLAARYGGEEFALILPLTDAAGAERVARELNAVVRALGIPHEDSSVAGVVTVSVGHATLVPGVGAEPESLIERADRALYRAKEEGRDRVCGAG